MSIFLEAENGGRSLILEHSAGIRLGSKLITPEDLEQDSQRWQNKVLLISGSWDGGDESVLRQLINSVMPLTLIGDHREERLVMGAELARFPYSINGHPNFESFALRLIPERGRIARIILNHSTLAVNHCHPMIDHVDLGLGNGKLHLEIYFEYRDQKNLPLLLPLDSYRPHVVTYRETATL